MKYIALITAVFIVTAAVFIILIQKKRLNDRESRRKMAYIDALTGIKNRMAYIEQINALERKANAKDTVHVIMLDIDDFKSINDTFGHRVGDRTLIKSAHLLNNIFNEDGFEVFRIGGDEFAVIAHNVAKDSLLQKIKYIESMDQCYEIGCTVSLGCSCVDFTQNNAMENAFIRAGRELYNKKVIKRSHVQSV